jgi:pSer/pThr/pTyr-binding forkhead associated (FHA) protein
VQLLEGGLRGSAFPLKEGDNLLGRENGDIIFPGDGFISSRHALLQTRSHTVILKDLGSSNGTFVRIDARKRLEDGDQLLIGRHLLKFELADA